MSGTENKITSHSSFQLEEAPLIASKSQSISPVAFFSIMVASAFAIATLDAVSAFLVSTFPSSHVPARLAIGDISAVHIF